MALLQQNFDSYLIYFRSGPDTLGPWAGGTRAIINCWKANSYVGSMTFMGDGVALPANTGSASSIQLNYPLAQFDNVVNILRYEKPLYLFLESSTWVGFLSTTSEPIGEQEAV